MGIQEGALIKSLDFCGYFVSFEKSPNKYYEFRRISKAYLDGLL